MKKKYCKNINWFTISELEHNIWGIAEFKHDEKAISYLIVGSKQALLFDTGMGIGNIKEIVRKITTLPILVINSHTHFDHIGGNHLFDDIIVFDHGFSKNNAQHGYSHSLLLVPARAKNFTQFPVSFNPDTYDISSFVWNKQIREGDIIDISPFRFKILHTPGHSPDAICLYEKEKGMLFAGDTLYEGPLYLFLPESDKLQYQKSLKKIMSLSNIKKIFAGHNEHYFSKEKIPLILFELASVQNKKNNRIKLLIDSKVSVLL